MGKGNGNFVIFTGKGIAEKGTFPVIFRPAVFFKLEIAWKIQFLTGFACEGQPFRQIRALHCSSP
jgi:hypothetical protein